LTCFGHFFFESFQGFTTFADYMIKWVKYTFVLLSLLASQSFDVSSNDINYQLSVSLFGSDFKELAKESYASFNFQEETLDFIVYEQALTGYFHLLQTGQLEQKDILTIVDFNKSSKKKRMWVLHLPTKQVVFNEWVAHGKNSGNEYAKFFSNTQNSRKSSIGFYLTGTPYNGKHRYSLKLHGLERGFNSNAFQRGIVIHGAGYVNEDVVSRDMPIGRSFGCPAVRQEVNADLVDLIKGGSCLYIAHFSERYLADSKYLNTEFFIPLEQAKRALNLE
jgi:hypothetical protein